MAEVVAQVRKGLDMLDPLPDSLWRRQQELDLQLDLGLAHHDNERFLGHGGGRDPRKGARAG